MKYTQSDEKESSHTAYLFYMLLGEIDIQIQKHDLPVVKYRYEI